MKPKKKVRRPTVNVGMDANTSENDNPVRSEFEWRWGPPWNSYGTPYWGTPWRPYWGSYWARPRSYQPRYSGWSNLWDRFLLIVMTVLITLTVLAALRMLLGGEL